MFWSKGSFNNYVTLGREGPSYFSWRSVIKMRGEGVGRVLVQWSWRHGKKIEAAFLWRKTLCLYFQCFVFIPFAFYDVPVFEFEFEIMFLTLFLFDFFSLYFWEGGLSHKSWRHARGSSFKNMIERDEGPRKANSSWRNYWTLP